MTAQIFRSTADTFTKAYVEAALWSSSAELGICDACDGDRVKVDPQTERCAVCGGKVYATDRSFQDLEFDIEEIAEETLDKIVADCKKFQEDNAEFITNETCLLSRDCDLQAGHDFWLNRNGHGCGFWETDDWEEKAGAVLDKASKAFGEINLYLGDDGLIYV